MLAKYALLQQNKTIPMGSASGYSHALGLAVEHLLNQGVIEIVVRKEHETTIFHARSHPDLSLRLVDYDKLERSGCTGMKFVTPPPGRPPLSGWYGPRALKYTVPPAPLKKARDLDTYLVWVGVDYSPIAYSAPRVPRGFGNVLDLIAAQEKEYGTPPEGAVAVFAFSMNRAIGFKLL